MDELLGRQVPNNIEAEQAVLGSMLIDPRCIGDVLGAVKADDFYSTTTSSCAMRGCGPPICWGSRCHS